MALPAIPKKFFHHGLQHTAQSRAMLNKMAKELKLERTRQKLSVAELARRVGIARSSLDHVERAHNFPAIPVYVGICRELGLSRPPLT